MGLANERLYGSWRVRGKSLGFPPMCCLHPFIEGLSFFRSPLYTIPSMSSCTTFMVGLKMVQGFLPFKPPRYCNYCLTAFLSPWWRVLSPIEFTSSAFIKFPNHPDHCAIWLPHERIYQLSLIHFSIGF